jgi:hypothetical protein
MLRNRLLILLGGCLLASSAAWADSVGYIDCRNHPDDTEVFAKPRKTPDTVTSVHCGDRFYILQYGFIFSRIQTGEGKTGYIYSNLINVDTSGVVQRSTTPQAQPTSVSTAPMQAPAPVAQPSSSRVTTPDARSTPEPARSQSSTTAAANKTVAVPASNGVPSGNVAAKAAAAPPLPTADSSTASSLNVVVNPDTGVPTSNSSTSPVPSKVEKTAAPPAAKPIPSSPKVADKPVVVSATEGRPSGAEKRSTDAEPTPQPALAPEPAVSAQVTVAASGGADTTAVVAQPDPTAHPEAEPAPAEPPAPIRSERDRWERPNPGGRRAPLIELFGGYSYARMVSPGTTTNLSGGLGSIGWNMTSWLQLVADTSYNVVTASGAKNVLYGNHWGPRVFHRGRNRWNISPFVEGLFGGSRSDTTVGGVKNSVNTFSIKAGGGLDIKPARHFEIRLINVDYYRTNFGGGSIYQNNYWASAGIVIRLFGRGEE